MKRSIKMLFLILAISTIYATECSYRRRPTYYTNIDDALVSDSWWDNQSKFTQAAVVVGGIVSFYYVGKWIYNYFFALTDAQEIEHALSQLEKDKVFHDQLAFAYNNECAIVMPMINIATANKYTANGIINILKPEITGKFSNKPYYNYVINLEYDVRSIESKKSELSTLKIRLFERKMRLHKNNDDKKMSAEEKAEYTRGYNAAIEHISTLHEHMQNLHYMLHEIRNYVIKTHEYSNEEKQVRIEQLERENAKLQSQAMLANAHAAAATAAYYTKPVAHTHITHVHIHQDEV